MGMIQAPDQTSADRLDRMGQLYEKDLLKICCLYLRNLDFKLLTDLRENGMLALKYEVVMYLVAYDQHAVLKADIAEPCKFLDRKHPSGRVLRATKKEQLDIVLYDLLLEILKIDVISVVIA